MDPISAITGAIGTVKTLYETSERMKSAELRQAIAELREKLVDAKAAFVDLKEENQRLRDELESAKKKTRPQDLVVVRDGVYYLKSPGPDDHPGPYCVGCLNNSGRLVPLSGVDMALSGVAKWHCAACRQYYH